MPSEYAALSRTPLAITVAGTRFSLPYRPAGAWIQGLAHLGTLAASLAELEERERIADLLLSHRNAGTDLRGESLRILEEASGWRWWEAGRLLSTSAQPRVLGRLVLAGADAYQRSVGEWCAATYALCVKGQDEKGLVKFNFSLSRPPAGYEDAWDDGGDDPAVTMAAVQAMMGNG